ncbi:xylose transport system permease XylH [Escherichia coli]|nr:D-xylose ABC transporter permease [Escherichia coli]SQR48482.1 xylose transport system permease XylH [Escherichia coli]SQS39700.1 xylose transport system permease XylH [Escherichia coli]SRY40448.1 xylose transport system permease XylH [Escherichia coli]SRY76313.1 xylose transport system permease XylH [Escherichia coli]
MSKSNPSEVKLAVPTSGGFSGLKSLNLGNGANLLI